MADNIQNTVTSNFPVNHILVEGNKGIDIILGSNQQDGYAKEVQVSILCLL
jgi:hypothetical protein